MRYFIVFGALSLVGCSSPLDVARARDLCHDHGGLYQLVLPRSNFEDIVCNDGTEVRGETNGHVIQNPEYILEDEIDDE